VRIQIGSDVSEKGMGHRANDGNQDGDAKVSETHVPNLGHHETHSDHARERMDAGENGAKRLIGNHTLPGNMKISHYKDVRARVSGQCHGIGGQGGCGKDEAD
jgi:hypothetical protein